MLINTEVFSQSTDIYELLISDWHLDKYFNAEAFYPPQENELNDRLYLFKDLTYESIDEGIFESGFAHGLGLPVVLTFKEDDLDSLHFDTSHYNILTWEEDKLPEFEEQLKNRILAVIGKGTYNPE